MGFEQPEELNNVEKKEDMSWVQDIITGKELEGRKIAEIGTADIDIYRKYFADKKNKYEIYTYKDNPELSLLVLDSFALQKQIFDELVDGNEEIKGGFGSDITVKEEAELELVHE